MKDEKLMSDFVGTEHALIGVLSLSHEHIEKTIKESLGTSE
jgi:hypothetical protein